MISFRKIKIKEEAGTQEEGKKWFKSEGRLTIDVYETDSDVIIQTAIAGVKLSDFDIAIENDMLEIKGVRENPGEDEEGKKYFFQECYWGPFSRKIILPTEVDNSRAKASIKEGVLTIKIPKLEREKKRKIKLKANKKKKEEKEENLDL